MLKLRTIIDKPGLILHRKKAKSRDGKRRNNGLTSI
jgi:hypothetical protein